MAQDHQAPRAPVLDEAVIPSDFDSCKALFKQLLGYVEDETFQWDRTVAYLILPLSETDSSNKVRGRSNATNIQITDSVDTPEGGNKADDFLPSLMVNSTFPGWRLVVRARMHGANIESLKEHPAEDPAGWIDSQIEIKRRPNLNGGQNPVIHICYQEDLKALRDQLWPRDYLILAKQKGETRYEGFGLKHTAPLGRRKSLVVSPQAEGDRTTFLLPDMIQDGGGRVTSYVRRMHGSGTEQHYRMSLTDHDPIYSVGDEIWVFDEESGALTQLAQVAVVNDGERTVDLAVIRRIYPPLTLERIRAIEALSGLIPFLEEREEEEAESPQRIQMAAQTRAAYMQE